MRLRCAVGFHEWSGCRCWCGKTRDEGHNWNGCKCCWCGKTRDEFHRWDQDCEWCGVCDQRRFLAHGWTGCKCDKCGKTRDLGHDWAEDCEGCPRCGKRRSGAHGWTGCKCDKCGKTRDEGHDWAKDCDRTSDCEKCLRCGRNRGADHEWDGYKCTKCGKTRVAYVLGGKGPGGGIVFHVDHTGFHGMEAKPSDEGEMRWPSAVEKARSYGSGWHLPTTSELLLLYSQRGVVGGFEDGFYWSSDEFNSDNGEVVVFKHGNSHYLRKLANGCHVRAVRPF